MDKKQKFLLAGAIIAYILVLVFFVRVDLPLMLVFLILHSVLLMTFAWTCYRAAAFPELDLELLRAEVERLQEENDSLLAAQKALPVPSDDDALAEKEAALEEAGRSLDLAQDKIVTLEEEIQTLRTELSMKAALEEKGKEEDAEDFRSLLPAAKNDPPQELNIVELAREVLSDMEPMAKKAGLSMSVSASQESYTVKASPELIRLLLRNIVDNSIKYMNRRGVLVVTISNIGTDLFIVLKDNGDGLSEAETSHVFELNFQGSNRVSGNGLGLTQAKAIVDFYGGTIYAKSMAGKGMGIYIQLPA